MDNKTLHIILLMIGISLGVIVSAQGEAPAPFFKKNVAKCFYCDDDVAVQRGFENNTSTQTEKSQAKQPVVTEAIPGIDPKSPLPFQKLVKAYESGDITNTYSAAKEWVQYQDRILKRTSDLAALVTKAKKEVEAESEMIDMEQSVTALYENQSNIRLAFFFDITNPKTEQAAEAVQNFYKETLANPAIEVFGIPAFGNSISELKTFKNEIGINFPIQYNQKMENEFEANSNPMVLAFRNNQSSPCRLEGSISPESISSLITQCNQSSAKKGGTL